MTVPDTVVSGGVFAILEWGIRQGYKESYEKSYKEGYEEGIRLEKQMIFQYIEDAQRKGVSNTQIVDDLINRRDVVKGFMEA